MWVCRQTHTERERNVVLLQCWRAAEREVKLSPQPMMSLFLFLQMMAAYNSTPHKRHHMQMVQRTGWGWCHTWGWCEAEGGAKMKSCWKVTFSNISQFHLGFLHCLCILTVFGFLHKNDSWTLPCPTAQAFRLQYVLCTEDLWLFPNNTDSNIQEVHSKKGDVLETHFTDVWFIGVPVY